MVVFLSGILIGVKAPVVWSDEVGTLKGEIEDLKEGQKALKKDMNEIKALLKGLTTPRERPAPQPFKPADVSIEGSPVLGDANAPVTIVEFTDYQCPFCRRHATGTFGQIEKEYVKTGKVRYVLRQFPLKSIHPNAAKASEATLCAGDQGRYWEMHHQIFNKTKTFNNEEWLLHANALKLNMKAFNDCMESGKKAAKVEQDLKDGMALGIRGTPGFFIGKSDPSDPDKFRAVEFLRGAYPYSKFKETIDKILKSS